MRYSKWVMKSTCIRCYQDSEVLMKGRRDEEIQIKHGSSLSPLSCYMNGYHSPKFEIDFQQRDIHVFHNMDTYSTILSSFTCLTGKSKS